MSNTDDQETILQRIADAMPDAVFIVDPDGAVLFANSAAASLAGADRPAALVGINFSRCAEPACWAHDSGKLRFGFTDLRGSERWVEGHRTEIPFHGMNAHLITLRDLSEKKSAKRRKAIQRELGIALAATSSIAEAADLCVKAALAISGMNCGALYLRNPVSGNLYLIHGVNLSEDFRKRASWYPADSGHVQVVLQGRPIYTTGAGVSALVHEPAASEDLKAIAIIPIRNKGRVIGCFNIGSYTAEEVPLNRRADLEACSPMIGAVIARISAEEAVLKYKNYLQSLFERLDDVILVANKKGQILYTNPAAASTLGYTPAELQALTFPDLHPPDLQNEAKQIFEDMLQGTCHFCTLPVMKRDGTALPVETRVSTGRWDDEDVIFGIVRDLTERTHAQEALHRRDAILRAVSFAAERFLSDDTWNNRIDEVLQNLGEAAGASRAYIFENRTDPRTGFPSTSFRWEWTKPGVSTLGGKNKLQNVPYQGDLFRWYETLSSGKSICGRIRDFPKCERAHLEPQGTLSLIVLPIFVDSRWWGFIGFDDCTIERKWTQTEIDALRAAATIIGSAIIRTTMNELFKKPVEKSLVGTYLIQNGVIHYINPRGAKILGANKDALLGRSFESWVHPDDLAALYEQYRREGKKNEDSLKCEVRGITASGRKIVLQVYGTTMTYYGEPAAIGTFLDITEKREMEEALRKSEESYRYDCRDRQ